MAGTAWLNGVFMSASEARISPFDRGFLFADSVYEVTAVYNRAPIDLDRHLDRLQRSLRELGYAAFPDRGEIETVHHRLIRDNDLREGYVYLQVSRGAYGGRDFVPPSRIVLTCFAFAESRPLIDTPAIRSGIRIITTPDIRWARRDIKTTGLLAQSLAKAHARSIGADDAWMVGPDGLITEGASSNAYIVTRDGRILTRRISNDILAGVTRAAALERLSELGLKFEEKAFSADDLRQAAEAFSTAATALVAPVVAVDGVPVGDGAPGPVTRLLQQAYFRHIGVDDRLIRAVTGGDGSS
jgi:D-alanine transaminase